MCVAAAGEHEDRRLVFVADAAEHLEAVEARHAEIEDHEVRPVGLPAAQGLSAVARLEHDESLATKDVRSEIESIRVVFHQQDLDHISPRE